MKKQRLASSVSKNNLISNIICGIIKETKLDEISDLDWLESKLNLILTTEYQHWVKDIDIYYTDNHESIIVEWVDRRNKQQCICYPISFMGVTTIHSTM